MLLGLKELESSRHRRRAMVVISGAGDETSRHTPAELKKLLQQTDVDVYGIGAFDRYAPRLMARTKALELDEVLASTCGRGISAYSEADFSGAADRVSQELHSQYLLGYYPTHRNPEGEWRELEVRLSGSALGAKLLHCSKGYHAVAD
jgi:VWFA-related protein